MAHRQVWRHAAAVASVALTSAIVGCSAPAGSTGSTGTTSCPSPGVSKDAIKVGLVYPDSGPLSGPFKTVRAGVEARIAKQNAAGGVGGRRIEVTWRDDESDPSANLTAARDLVENVGVFGLLEETAVASGSASYLADKGIPVAGIVAESVWGQYRNMFAFAYPYTTGPSVTTLGTYVAKAGGTRAIMVVSAVNPSSHGVAEKDAASLRSAGVSVVGQVSYAEQVTGSQVVVDAARDQQANVVVAELSGDALATIVQALRAAGISLKAAVGPDGYDRSLLGRYGADIAGMSVYLTTPSFQAQSAALDAYRAAIATYAPEQADAQQETTLQGYITADLFVRGLEAAGPCPTRAAFLSGLRAVRDYDAGGLLAQPLDMTAGFGQLNTCYNFVRVNPAGSDFDVVPGGAGPGGQAWCGHRIEG
ncbi:ABC transporter substrate-binding protein [Pseudofrankia sp. BMG5.36]|uniref:ABC transporter substrate-binding protein n=1 Tax=Pseudofrankia sp. BMG5.36 TaxID=1834512 RepID=UPI0008D914AF|nr:ABC transporter substrate-binding protein [Pseudofrankia sp. BMG5.36]OHV44574.1 hypothetical protein BCD48_25295 [Pseudofrankia sp. BMG5.36]